MAAFCLIFLQGCQSSPEPILTLDPDAEVAIWWADLTLSTARSSAGHTPTYTSRSLAYMGLTMYEAVVHGNDQYRSLAGQLNGLSTLPQPESGQNYHWIISLNAGQAAMLRNLYPHAGLYARTRIDSLEAVVLARYSGSAPPAVVERSVAFGQSVAGAVYEWSKTDGGHRGYLFTALFPNDYTWPATPGHWAPPAVGQSPVARPLHPHWGNNRTFVAENGNLAVPAMITYSTDVSSAYFAQMKEVYDKNKRLTQEEKEIAAWWGDDPSETFAPPGHSYNLASIAIRNARPDVFTAAGTYAHVGMAVADAFINCWKCKYKYHAERPGAYINAQISTGWLPFWPEPPFPAFSSGHATQSAAAAEVLTDLYGHAFAFIDNSHAGRPKDELRNVRFVSRSFNSFWEAAEESAYSRLLGGVHTRQDNETGLREGKKSASISIS